MTDASPQNVLLVEDNPDLLDAHRDLLASLGSRVVVARDAEQAARAARTTGFDLLVVNAFSSRQTGLEIVDQVRRERSRLPALLLSGFGDDAELRRRVERGEIALLPMPFEVDQLASAVAAALDQKPPAAAEVGGSLRPEGEAPKAPAAERSTASPPLRLVSAAVALVALAASWGLWSRRAPALPAPDEAAPARSAALELLAPEGEIAAPPSDFSWVAFPGATQYRVVVRSVDGAVIWREETGANAFSPPTSLVDELERAVSYYWRVEAMGERGERVSRSHLVEFRINPTVGGPSHSTEKESRNG